MFYSGRFPCSSWFAFRLTPLLLSLCLQLNVWSLLKARNNRKKISVQPYDNGRANNEAIGCFCYLKYFLSCHPSAFTLLLFFAPSVDGVLFLLLAAIWTVVVGLSAIYDTWGGGGPLLKTHFLCVINHGFIFQGTISYLGADSTEKKTHTQLIESQLKR